MIELISEYTVELRRLSLLNLIKWLWWSCSFRESDLAALITGGAQDLGGGLSG